MRTGRLDLRLAGVLISAANRGIGHQKPASQAPVIPGLVNDIDIVRPNQAAQNSAAFTLTANGSSFQTGASIVWTTTNGTSVNLPASFVSAAEVQATAPANLLATAGMAQVAIQNPGFGLTVQQPFLITGVNASQQPQLTSINPTTVLKKMMMNLMARVVMKSWVV